MIHDDTMTLDELRAVTDRARPAAQAAVLARMGLPYRYTGRAVLLDRHVAAAHALLPQDVAGGVRMDQVRG